MSEATNGIDQELARKYFGLDDECEARILELQVENMNAQREVREAQKRHYKSGIAEGLPKDAFKLALKQHRLTNKHARQLENLVAEEENDTVDLAGEILDSLGDFEDLPLGVATKEREETEGKRGDAPKAAKGRKSKAKDKASEAAPASGRETLDALTDADTEGDVRPRFLSDADRLRAEENAKLLEGGIKPLNDSIN